MATIKSKNRRQLIPSANLPEREREPSRWCGHRQFLGLDVGEKRRLLIGCCRDAAAAAPAVTVAAAPLRPLAARGLQPIAGFALRGAEAADQTCRSCCCCCWGKWRGRVAAEDQRRDFVNHFKWGRAPLTLWLLKSTRQTDNGLSQQLHRGNPSLRD